MNFKLEDFKNGLWLLLKNANENLKDEDIQKFSNYAETEFDVFKAEINQQLVKKLQQQGFISKSDKFDLEFYEKLKNAGMTDKELFLEEIDL